MQYSFVLQCLEDWRIKMQSCCGCGYRAGYLSIDGLIALGIKGIGAVGDIRRQRNLAKALQQLQDGMIKLQQKTILALAISAQDDYRRSAAALKVKRASIGDFFARAKQSDRLLILENPLNQDL